MSKCSSENIPFNSKVINSRATKRFLSTPTLRAQAQAQKNAASQHQKENPFQKTQSVPSQVQLKCPPAPQNQTETPTSAAGVQNFDPQTITQLRRELRQKFQQEAQKSNVQMDETTLESYVNRGMATVVKKERERSESGFSNAGNNLSQFRDNLESNCGIVNHSILNTVSVHSQQSQRRLSNGHGGAEMNHVNPSLAALAETMKRAEVRKVLINRH